MRQSWQDSSFVNFLGEKLSNFSGEITSVAAIEARLVVYVEDETALVMSSYLNIRLFVGFTPWKFNA